MDPSVATDERSAAGSVNIAAASWPPPTADNGSGAGASAADVDVDATVDSIVHELGEALRSQDAAGGSDAALRRLFVDGGNCYWRDHAALSWDLRTLKGADKIAAFLRSSPLRASLSFEVDRSSEFRKPHQANLDCDGGRQGHRVLRHICHERRGRPRGFPSRARCRGRGRAGVEDLDGLPVAAGAGGTPGAGRTPPAARTRPENGAGPARRGRRFRGGGRPGRVNYR